ncbi:MAG: cytochrome c biogenesis protein CcmG/thiol:disulfide interchange protein DsbE [Myxococcota bacterium]
MTSASRPKINVWVLALGLALVLPLVALLASGFGTNPMAIRSQLVDRSAPDFQLVDLEGVPVRLSELVGQPVVLNFWSTWCGPCKYEHPMLLRAASANPDVRFFGVIYQDEPSKIRRYLMQQGTAYPHLEDPGGRVAIDYGVTGVPETYFIDRHGIVVHKQNGPLDPTILQAWLAALRSR